MDPHRSYPDESEPRRHRTEQSQAYAEPDGPTWFETHGSDTAPRTSARHGGRMPAGAPPGMIGPMGQWAGEPLPPPPPATPPEVSQRDPMAYRDPATTTGQTYRTGGRATGPATVSDGSHRTRRPAVGAVIGIVSALMALPVLDLLRDSVFSPSPSTSGVISSVLVLLGLPLGSLGLYGLVRGVRVPNAPASYAWLRPPVAYLVVALVLFVAAGLAAS